ncbi:radical SAM family heme chaperone HemW [Candidatus Halobeggiatoa sp. HSG11]|nr:radical SAM family heme chaperone HemW [Candidatus Halobeggiatoa sp. HSG11]
MTKNTHLEPTRRGFITNLTPSRRGFITNYPNFQHWKQATDAKLLAAKPLNIYVHIPFCAQQCSYCYYRTVTGSRKSEIDIYVEALCKEIEIATKKFRLNERPVVSIYFGGGTPTLLDGTNLAKIIDTIRNNLNVIEGAEFTVEGEPVTLIQKKANILKDIGVNRISLGVQSLYDDVIKLSNRQDTEKKVLKAIDFARNTGAIVNIDLMSGLAGETPKTWAYSVKRAIETEVESITVYKMELYANTQYYKDVRNKTIDLPSDEQELEFMQHAMEKFEQSEYEPWCFFTFTKKGKFVHVHAPSIWRGDDYYPFGASAFGRLGDWVFQSTNEVNKYVSIVEKGELPISRGHNMTSLDKMIRDIVLGMKLIRLDLKMFKSRYGFKLSSFCEEVMQQLESDGFITFNEEEVVLTKKGMLHGDFVGKSLSKPLMNMY